MSYAILYTTQPVRTVIKLFVLFFCSLFSQLQSIRNSYFGVIWRFWYGSILIASGVFRSSLTVSSTWTWWRGAASSPSSSWCTGTAPSCCWGARPRTPGTGSTWSWDAATRSAQHNYMIHQYTKYFHLFEIFFRCPVGGGCERGGSLLGAAPAHAAPLGVHTEVAAGQTNHRYTSRYQYLRSD